MVPIYGECAAHAKRRLMMREITDAVGSLENADSAIADVASGT